MTVLQLASARKGAPAPRGKKKPRRGGRPHGKGLLINRARVRRLVIDTAEKTGRGGVITRVGASVYADCERVLRQHIRGLVSRHPSGFATLEAE